MSIGSSTRLDGPESPRTETPVPIEDLCGTCSNGERCALRVQSRTPIHQCELFENEATALWSHHTGTEPRHLSAVRGEHVKGLCTTCDHLVSCTLPRPSSGVWHCEEYR